MLTRTTIATFVGMHSIQLKYTPIINHFKSVASVEFESTRSLQAPPSKGGMSAFHHEAINYKEQIAEHDELESPLAFAQTSG